MDMVIIQFQNRIQAFLSEQKCMTMVLVWELVKPFSRVIFSNLLIVCCNFLWIASIVGDLYIMTVIQIEWTFNTRVYLLQNIIDFDTEQSGWKDSTLCNTFLLMKCFIRQECSEVFRIAGCHTGYTDGQGHSKEVHTLAEDAMTNIQHIIIVLEVIKAVITML